MIEGLAFSEKSWTKCYYPKNEEAPAFRSAPAYPVLKEELEVTAPKKARTFAELSALPAPKAGKEAAAETETRLQAAQQARTADETVRDCGCYKETAMVPAVKIGPRPGTPAAAEIPEETKQPEKPANGNRPNTETPVCVEIVLNAAESGSVYKDGSPGFTDGGILSMASDPFPDRVFPNIADRAKKTSEQIGGG